MIRPLLSILFIHAVTLHALDRPKLQILNAGEKAVEVFWIAADGKRVPNGKIEPGKDSIIGTSLGHRFVIVDGGKETEVVSRVPVQSFRHDPNAKDGIPAFYTQVVHAQGYPICASAKVNPYALKEAASLADLMLAKRPDVREAMIASGSRLCILAHDEFTTDQPEWAWLEKVPVPGFESMSIKDYRDARARGMGGSATDPFCSCGEENLLAYEGDPYSTECIFIHEFAHNIHLRGLANVDATFDRRVKANYDAAMKAGLWKGKYASVNHHEYFAEGVQSWFDNNRENDHDHNHVNTRAELLAYDPGLVTLCREVFGDTELKYTNTSSSSVHTSGSSPVQAAIDANPTMNRALVRMNPPTITIVGAYAPTALDRFPISRTKRMNERGIGRPRSALLAQTSCPQVRHTVRHGTVAPATTSAAP